MDIWMWIWQINKCDQQSLPCVELEPRTLIGEPWIIIYQFSNIFKLKRDINQLDFCIATLILADLIHFHPLEVVNRVSETQLQVGENFILFI